LGGGMRQVGYIAAAGMYALDHHIERLTEDHRKALLIKEALLKKDFVSQVLPVETNIVIAHIQGKYNAASLVQALKEKNILSIAMSPTQVRFVLHLDISDDQLNQTLEVLQSL
jgi:threonine aldolase